MQACEKLLLVWNYTTPSAPTVGICHTVVMEILRLLLTLTSFRWRNTTRIINFFLAGGGEGEKGNYIKESRQIIKTQLGILKIVIYGFTKMQVKHFNERQQKLEDSFTNFNDVASTSDACTYR